MSDPGTIITLLMIWCSWPGAIICFYRLFFTESPANECWNFAMTKWRKGFGIWWRVEYKIADLWLGIYWDQHNFYFCPTLAIPIHFRLEPPK